MQLCRIALLFAAVALHCACASSTAAVSEEAHTGIEDLLNELDSALSGFHAGTAGETSAVATGSNAPVASSQITPAVQTVSAAPVVPLKQVDVAKSSTTTSNDEKSAELAPAVSNVNANQAEQSTLHQFSFASKLSFTPEKAYCVYMIFNELCSNSAITDAHVASALKRLGVNASDVFAFKDEIGCSPAEHLTRLAGKHIPATMTGLSILATKAKSGDQCTCAAAITRRLIDNDDRASLGAWIKVPGALNPGHILYAVRHASATLPVLIQHKDTKIIDSARNFIFPNAKLSPVGVQTSRLLHQHLVDNLTKATMVKDLSDERTVAGSVLQYTTSYLKIEERERLFVAGSNEHSVVDLEIVVRNLPLHFGDYRYISKYTAFLASIGTDGKFSVTDAMVAALFNSWSLHSEESKTTMLGAIANAQIDFDLSTTFYRVPTLRTVAMSVFSSQTMRPWPKQRQTMRPHNSILADPRVVKAFQVGPRAALLYDLMKVLAYEGDALPWGVGSCTETCNVLTCALQHSAARAQASGQLLAGVPVPAHCMAQARGLSDHALVHQLVAHQAAMLMPAYVLQTLVMGIRHAQPAVVQEAVDSVVRSSTLFVGFFNRHAKDVWQALAAARRAHINEWTLRDMRLRRLRTIESILSKHVSMRTA